MKHGTLLFSLVFLALSGTASPQDVASVVRDTDLRQDPSAAAASLRRLGKGQAIVVLKRQGGWYEILADQAKGWVKLLDVRLSLALAAGSSGLSELVSAVTGRTSTTSATGVRGLDEEKLRSASPNVAELAKLDGMVLSRAEGDAFAREGGLAGAAGAQSQP